VTDPDRYLTVADGPEAEIKVDRSRFVARLLHVEDEASAAEALERVRRAHHAARHHGFALRIGAPGALRERADDAGEPAGTAGRPILARLARAGLHDALLVVSRYFGGIKLGTGGLSRAYGDAAQAALDATPVEVVVLTTRLAIDCTYDDVGLVEAAVARAGSDVDAVTREFTAGPRLVLRVRRSRANALSEAIVEATAGRARVGVGVLG
jgi:uncharacterized YigZ family protein